MQSFKKEWWLLGEEEQMVDLREREREREQSFFFSPRLIFVFKFQGFKSYLFESIFVWGRHLSYFRRRKVICTSMDINENLLTDKSINLFYIFKNYYKQFENLT